MAKEVRTIKIPAAVANFLDEQRKALAERKVEHVRLVPLILRAPLDEVMQRRRRIFNEINTESKDWGYEVQFSRRLRRVESEATPRTISGSFHVLKISSDIAVLSDNADREVSMNGTKRFSDKVYPLAKRPFFPSTALTKLIETSAEREGLTAISLDAKGYHRETGGYRQDRNRQTPAEAAAEMAVQKRNVHVMMVRFKTAGKKESARISFDRHASANVKVGDPLFALKELVLPGVMEAQNASATFQVERATDANDQEMVELEFKNSPFDDYESMALLCSAIRKRDGLNVSIIHLNPYLQAQVIDFFSGAVVDVLVTDDTNVSLIPRSPKSGPAVERIANTIFEFFGEAKARRTIVLESA
jgi:hypothetical protein